MSDKERLDNVQRAVTYLLNSLKVSNIQQAVNKYETLQQENARKTKALELMADEILQIRSCAPMEDTEDENFNCEQCKYERKDCINEIIKECLATEALQQKG